MASTTKPLSTISYNTIEFLQVTLRKLTSAGVIDDYRWIRHKGENGDKDHIHLWIQPGKYVKPVELKEMFNEADVTSTKPLGVLPFRNGDPYHWIMYALHDPVYLKNHQSDNDGDGKYPYTLQDIQTPYTEQLQRDYNKAIDLRETKNQKIIRAFASGMTAIEIAYQYNLPSWDIMNIEKMFRDLASRQDGDRTLNVNIQPQRMPITQCNGNCNSCTMTDCLIRNFDIRH